MQKAQSSPFANRLRKNDRRLRRFASRGGLTAFRIYDSDIPEYRFVVDRYADHVHVVELERRGFMPSAEQEAQRDEVREAIVQVLGVPEERIHWKRKAPKVWGTEQYEKLGSKGERIVVEEGGLRFWVNLDDYIDTGLFLDHRNTRALVGSEARGKNFLNLFAYTGAFTVHAAAGGAKRTTSVDLSNTYLDWAKENLELNGLWGAEHELIRADATRWIRQALGRTFDLIVLDPPSFSASKKMQASFDIQRDHVGLLEETAALLAPGGVLYFSTNFTGFVLDDGALASLSFEELTPGSLPEDIRNRTIHRCWRIERS